MSSNQQHGAASAAAQGGQQQAAAPRPSQPAIVRATASYRVFSSSTFVHANITCTCHLLFTLMIALKVGAAAVMAADVLQCLTP